MITYQHLAKLTDHSTCQGYSTGWYI